MYGRGYTISVVSNVLGLQRCKRGIKDNGLHIVDISLNSDLVESEAIV